MVLRAAVLSLLALSCLQAQKKKGSADEVMRPNPAAASPQSSTLATCPAGGPLGEMDLQVSSGNNQPLPFFNIVHLTEGDVVRYKPLDHGREKRTGDVSLVLVPTKISGKDELIVTDAEDAAKPQEWKIPQTIALAVFVYGPQGLSKKKVKNFLSQDNSLVAQLAEYADKTAQTQALITALSSASSSSASVNAALTGFASQYGISVTLDKAAPPATQAQAMFTAMNPQLANYNPVAGSTAAVAGQTASLATAAAGLFFGSPVGLLAGGTSMLLGLRSIAFPDTQFRSSFPQPLKGSTLNLCGDRGATPPHTRIAFIWASRIPNAQTPKIQIQNSNYIPVSQKSPVSVTMAEADWKFLQRARDWFLEDDAKHRTPINALKLENQKAIEIDLTKATLPAGQYHLGAFWDWAEFGVTGDVHVKPLSNFSAARLQPASQDQLLARGGKVPVTLTGSDFEFTTKVQIKKSGDEFAVPQNARFILPKGLREGPQEQMDLQIDAQELDPGAYQVLIEQQGGSVGSVPIKILPNAPKLTNLPIIANQGVDVQHYVLKGERLDSLMKLEATGAELELGAASTGNTERNLTVKLRQPESDGNTGAKLAPGTKVLVKAYMKDRSEPLTMQDALEITGPLPAIVSSKLSLPSDMAVAIRPAEFPAGSTLSAMLDVKNFERKANLQLACADGSWEGATLRVGEQTANWSLQQLSPDQLFFSFDTGKIPAGCDLQAAIDNGKDGKSKPFSLAHIITVPKIEAINPAPDAPGGTAGSGRFSIDGKNLEMIAKVGWDASAGTDVASLPTPIPGEGQKQRLTVELPVPAATSPTALTVWLRGDQEGRATTVKYVPPPPIAHE